MKKYQKNRLVRRSNKKKIILLVIAGIVLLAGVFVVLEKTNTINLISKPSTAKTPTVQPKPDDETINFQPPSEEEKQAGDQQKEDNIVTEKRQNTPPVITPSNKRNVSPTIVSASKIDGQIDVRAFIEGVVEDGGICTATFTKAGAATVVKNNPGTADSKVTTCQPFIFNQSELPGSGWSVKVNYSSTKAEGVSESIPVTVQ